MTDHSVDEPKIGSESGEGNIKVVYNLGATFERVNISDNARVILGNYNIPDVDSEVDPKLLRDAIESRHYQQPEPPILHAGFPLVRKYESYNKRQWRSARAISPNRTTSGHESSTKSTSFDKYNELKRLCSGNRVADLRNLLREYTFSASSPLKSTALADALISATAFGFIDIVDALLLSGVSPDLHHCRDDGTPLHVAVATGNEHMVELLLKHRADVNALGGPAETALKLALLAAEPKLNIISRLLQAGAIVQDAGRYPSSLQACVYRDQRVLLGILCRTTTKESIDFAHQRHGSALQTAAAYGKLECARILEDFGARYDVPCTPYGSPIHAAAYWGQLDVCRMALRHTSNFPLNFRSTCWTTPFHFAVRHGHYEIVRFLLSKDDAVEQSTASLGHTSLLEAAILSGSTETLDLVLRAGVGAGPTVQSLPDLSLASIIEMGYSAMACKMIDIGFDRDGRPLSYYNVELSPMRMAALKGDLDMVRYLLALHADSRVDAVREAAAVGYHRVVIYLARRCPQTFEEERDAALAAALRGAHRVTASYLALHGALFQDLNGLLEEIVHDGSVEALRLLIDLVGPNSFSPATQNSALYLALCRGRREVIDTLLTMFPNIPQYQHSLERTEPDSMALAIDEKDPATLDLLLRSGFDPNAGRYAESDSPLARAVGSGQMMCVRLLLRQKADPNIWVRFEKASQTLLCFAIMLCPPEHIFFGSAGVSLEAKDPPRTEIVRALVEAGADVEAIGLSYKGNNNHSQQNLSAQLEKSVLVGELLFTPINFALTRGLYSVTMDLVRKGAKFGALLGRTVTASNAVRRALFTRDTKSAEKLLQAGVKIEDDLLEYLQRSGYEV